MLSSKLSLDLNSMSFAEVPEDPREPALTDQSSQPGSDAATEVCESVDELTTVPYSFCVDYSRATAELLALPKEERMVRAIEELLICSEGPFAPDALTEPAPLTCRESLAVQLFFTVVMGGPILLGFLLIAALAAAVVARRWVPLAVWVVATAAMAAHPFPSSALESSTFTLALYKYFSYKWVWVDGTMARMDGEGAQPWCSVGVPHGVLPIGALLQGMAANTFTSGKYAAGSASVVLRTPFLRYMFLFIRGVDVSASTIKKEISAGSCVGIIADGIAGIFAQSDEVKLATRKGLAKISLQTGVPLVPAFHMGSAPPYTAFADPCGMLEGLSRRLQVSVFAFWGRYGPVPRRVVLVTLLGRPVFPEAVLEEPGQAAIDEVHEQLLCGFQAAFDTHKAACGGRHRELRFT